jgi:hypothetical protein
MAIGQVGMALCLNPACQKRVATNTTTCVYCGGQEISEFNSYSKEQALIDQITMENFQTVIKSTEPFIEKTILPKGSKGSMKSQISVRLQYLKRRVFNRP